MKRALRLATAATALVLAAVSSARAETPRPTFAKRFTARELRIPQTDGLEVLYDQTGVWSGIGVPSQNFESAYDAYDCEGADDFVVPRGVKWRVKEIYVMGTYFDGVGPADSENVVFYENDHGKPGNVIAAFNGIVTPDDGSGLLTIDLGKGVKLKHGHYWVSAQANQNFENSGQFGWLTFDTEVFNKPSVWRNPNDGFGTGCTDWGTTQACSGFDMLGDYKFALKGKELAL
jgi:hypothetical protein